MLGVMEILGSDWTYTALESPVGLGISKQLQVLTEVRGKVGYKSRTLVESLRSSYSALDSRLPAKLSERHPVPHPEG